jgi:RHS repeat-associated protein
MLDTIPRYLFTAAERDAESNFDYMNARYYSSDDVMFISRDQHFERYPYFSPYSYAINCPTNYYDPTGMDVYKADGEGGVERVRWSIIDKVYSVDKDGNKINKINFKHGTIKELSHVKEENNNYNIVKVKGDNQAQALFEFLATPENFGLEAGENVEWGRTLTGEAGANGINFLTTSGEKDNDKAGSYLFNNQLKNGYTIRGHDHNHPTNNPNPSGTGPGEKNGDIPFLKQWKRDGNITPNAQFRIFTHGLNEKYHTYDENTKVTLPEVIIKPR